VHIPALTSCSRSVPESSVHSQTPYREFKIRGPLPEKPFPEWEKRATFKVVPYEGNILAA
jgi:hypothetical protein